MKELLVLDSVSCGYKAGFKISEICLSLSPGVFAGIVGPNGSGKTTLFRGICGELPLLEGSIRFRGEDVSRFSYREKSRKIAVVSQFPEVANISVEEYVLMGLTDHHRWWCPTIIRAV